MTHDWRTHAEKQWLRPTAAVIAAALFVGGLSTFVTALLRPFEEPRLFLLACDGDPATAGASPLERLAAANPGRTVCHTVDKPAGRDWLSALGGIGEQAHARDTAIVFLRGAWFDAPEPAFCDSRSSTGITPSAPLDLDEVIAHVERLPTATLILCLDDSDPELDQFSERLQQFRAKAAVSRVVIVTSHMLGEESFPLPGRQCTTFGHAIAQALCANADRNRDDAISLHEFLNSLQQQVDGWAAALTAGRESQTPLVIVPAGLNVELSLSPVLQHAAERPRGNGDTQSDVADAAAALRSQLMSSWQLADELIGRAIKGEVPLVISRGLHRDLQELERRWRFGESSGRLKGELTSLHATLTALTAGEAVSPGGPQWARDLQALLAKSAVPGLSSLSDDAALAPLRKLLDEGATRDAVLKWLAESDRRIPDRTRLLVAKLAADARIPDDLWRNVLLTRLNIEQEGESLPHSSWAFAERITAERAALRAERLLLDQIERNWAQRSRQADQTAGAALARVHAVEELRTHASALCRGTLWNFPDLLDTDMRLQFWENDPSEVGVILDSMLVSLASLRTALGREALDDPGLVERLVRSLEADRHRLLQPVRDIAAQARTSAMTPPAVELMRLLRSTLLSAPERTQLLATWTQLAADLPGEPPKPTAAGRVIVRGLADGLAGNCLRRVRFERLFGDPSQWEAAAQAVAHVDADGSFLNALQQFHGLEAQWLLQQPAALRQQCNRLIAGPLTVDCAVQCRLLWNAFDGLRHESQLPSDWSPLADRLLDCRTIRRLDRSIQLVQLARNDAADWERDCYDRREADLRAARSTTVQWPAPEYAASPVLSGPNDLTLGQDSNSDLTLLVERLPDDDGPLDLTVQYDEAQYIVSTGDGRQMLSATTPPQPYVETSVDSGTLIAWHAGDPRTVTVLVRPNSIDARPGSLLVRLQGPNWTSRAMCQLLPPRTLPVELVLEDELGAIIPEEMGFIVEPYPNRTGSLRWSLQNNSAVTRRVGISIYAIDAAPVTLPQYAIPPDSLAELLRTLPQKSPVIEVPAVELAPDQPPAPIPFPKQGHGTSPLSMQGGLIVAVSDHESGLTRLQRVRFRPQRPLRFVTTSIEYGRADGRITIRVEAQAAARLPGDGIPVTARVIADPGVPMPVRSAGRLTPQMPQTTLTLLGDPGANHRVELDVAEWPRAVVYDIVDGQPLLSEQSAVRVVSPPPGTIYQTPDTIPVRVEVDATPMGFLTEGDWFEVGVDANHDRRLDREDVVRIDRDRNVTLNWLEANPDGSTTFDVAVGDFEFMLPTDGLRNQQADILAGVVRAGQAEVWGAAVPVVFDSSAPQMTGLELQPGPTVVIGQPVVLLSHADDAGLSGVSTVEVSFDPTRTGRFDEKAPPVAAVPLKDGTWRAETPTDKLEQGRHLLLARAVDRAGNAEEPRRLWIEAITAEEAARRQAARTTAVSGQLFYGTQPVSGITVTLTPDHTAAAAPAEPMNTEKSSSPAKSLSATSGKDGKFLIPAVPGGKYSFHIEGTLRGQKFERHSELTIDVDQPPSAISVRLDRPADAPGDAS